MFHDCGLCYYSPTVTWYGRDVTKMYWFGVTFLVSLVALYVPLTLLCTQEHPWRLYPDGEREEKCKGGVVPLLGIGAGLLLGVSGGGLMVSILVLIYRETYQRSIHHNNDGSVHSGESGETESVMDIDESFVCIQLQLPGTQDGTGLEQGPPQNSGAPSANESMDMDVESNDELRLELDGSTKHPTGSTFSSVRQENQHHDSLDDESSEANINQSNPVMKAMTKT
jgi:hypothetical protein